MSPLCILLARSFTVVSVNAAGIISHAALGGASCARNWSREVAPFTPGPTSFDTFAAFTSNTTHSCPAFTSLCTMLAPILPRPIIPSCIDFLRLRFSLACSTFRQPAARKTGPSQPLHQMRTFLHQLPQESCPVILDHYDDWPLVQSIMPLGNPSATGRAFYWKSRIESRLEPIRIFLAQSKSIKVVDRWQNNFGRER